LWEELKEVVRPARLELATSWFVARRSIRSSRAVRNLLQLLPEQPSDRPTPGLELEG
jgi:hypothetical protein